MVLDPATSDKITNYRPRNPPAVWDEVAPLVRSVVAATVTTVPYDVERLLHITARLALWAVAAGLEREPDAWLRNEAIDAFVLSLATEIKASTIRTYRTWLLRVRDALAFSERGETAPARLHAPVNPHQPYTRAELAGLRHWAAHLAAPAAHRRTRPAGTWSGLRADATRGGGQPRPKSRTAPPRQPAAAHRCKPSRPAGGPRSLGPGPRRTRADGR
ncbi:hypothetical protein ACRAWF_46775 [Streptomyces sp. L7]